MSMEIFSAQWRQKKRNASYTFTHMWCGVLQCVCICNVSVLKGGHAGGRGLVTQSRDDKMRASIAYKKLGYARTRSSQAHQRRIPT